MSSDQDQTIEVLRRAVDGDANAMECMFAPHRERLKRMVHLRLDRRLEGRIDASDVIQETYVEALQRLAAYVERPDMPFFLWLRFLTGQKILAMHRHHFGVQGRDVRRETHPRALAPKASAESITDFIVASQASPSEAAMRAELRERVLAAIAGMKVEDREILSLRHLEQLSNAEAAAELGLSESTASKRYVRAFTRLRDVLGGLDGAVSDG